MKEVSCKILDIFFREIASKGLSPEVLAEGTGVSVEVLRDKNERINWHVFVRFINNAAQIWTADQFVELGRKTFRMPYMRYILTFARLLFGAMDFYEWLFTKGGDQAFTCIRNTFKKTDSKKFTVGIEVIEGYEPCPEFFLATKGNLIEMPALLGLPPSEVVMEPTERGALYHVTVPEGGAWLRRAKQFVLWPFTIRVAAHELQDANDNLMARYHELDAAKQVLSRQAQQLETVNVLGRELTQHTDLGSLGDAVSTLLTDRFSCSGLRLWLVRRSGDAPQVVREVGRLGPGEAKSFRLTTAGELLGQIDAWGQEIGQGTHDELLQALVPWISIALENARNFALLREYQEGLEKKVSERTAELKSASEQLAESLRRVVEVDRQKTEFFANASHELRTPLTLLLAPLETLVSGDGLPSRARDEIRSSLRNAYRLLKLINDLLDLSKIEAGRMELRSGLSDLTAMLNAVLEPWRSALEQRNIRLEMAIPPTLPLMADTERLEQVALNLVSNAVKHTPDGGWIRVAAGQQGDSVEFAIENSGEGIDPEEIPQLFERFGQSLKSKSRRFGSTGLGLPVVRELVKLHGGDVSVDSTLGERVAFRVRLPIGDLPEEGPLAAAAAKPTTTEVLQYQAVAARPEARVDQTTTKVDADAERPLLLIAEDNPDVRGFLSRNLSGDFVILEAGDGNAALKIARELLPDVVLSDLMMPEMDGIELCKQLKADPNTMAIPFILLTARADMEGKLTGLQAGADDYVIKPFHLEEIKARLSAQLRLKALAETVAQNEKLAALGVMVAGVAHEIRNPLNGIINSLVPIQEMVSKNDEAQALLELAISSARRVDQVSLMLLQQARMADGIKAEVDLVSNVALAVQLLSHKTTVGPRIVSDISTTSGVTVVAEPGALNQVWINLIDNAIQAAGPAGEVRVSLRYAGDTAQVEVSDNGPGIDPLVMKKIFDPFFTTKPVGSGTGLGLSLVRDIVEKHGGNVAVHSTPGEGSRFRVSLPATRIVRGEAYAG